MRLFFAIAALMISGLSILPDIPPFSLDTRFCQRNLCRFDQMFSRIDSQGMNLSNVGSLLDRDPLNPLVWCAYGELLSQRGQTEAAEGVFDRAIRLGPDMPPVLMRAANFDFAHDRIDQGNLLAYRILALTSGFDEVLFSYMTGLRVPTVKLLGTAIPGTPRAARAWAAWLNAHGTDEDLRETWSWMQQNHLTDQSVAVNVTWALWQRKSFGSAQEVWADWVRPADSKYLHPQRLSNRRFEKMPSGSPLDWALSSPASVQVLRQDGLEIRFSGTENVDFSQVHQFATVKPGRYRFSVEVSADGLTTDQRPLFHIFDPVNAARLNVETQPLSEVTARSWTTLDFNVMPGTEFVAVQMERRQSQHFDNKIAGSVHVYQVSLAPLS